MNKDIIERSIKEYGRITQSVICMEECSELIQAVSKQIRGIGSKALYDAYTKLAPVELYNSTSTAYNANITLTQNVNNFKTIEIFFVDNDGDDNSIRIRAAAGKFKMISHTYVGGTWYDKFTYYAVSGTKLNFSSSYQKNQGGVVESGNYHKIYRVVGYKD